MGEGSHAKIITTVEKYNDFFTTEASMLAWADPNWEMQNVCNVIGIDLNIFLYQISLPLPWGG